MTSERAAQAGRAGSLETALLQRIRRPVDLTIARTSVALDVEHGDGWTLHLDGGSLWLARGLSRGAATTISTDPDTMVDLLEGRVSGIDAFINGRLRVRGNLALSLRLSGSLGDGPRPAHFPVARDVTAAGIKTFLLEAGEGPPVLLLHGLGATNASMLPTLWDLSRDMHVIAPDLPGFGDSSKPLRSYDADFFSMWVGALLDEAGIDTVDVIGNSLGGRVAIEASLRFPERIRNLVLFAPSPAFIRKREFVRIVKLLRPEMALLPVPLSHDRVVASIKAMFSKPQRLPEAWYLAAADEFLRVFSSPRGRIAFFSAARQIYLEEPYGDKGFWDRLPELAAPSLFVWGKRDRLVPPAFAKHLERALPGARSIVLDDCGHVPQFELPERTHELTREFLSG